MGTEDILATHELHKLLHGVAMPLTLNELLDDDGILAEVSRIDSRRRLQVVRRGWGQAILGISPKPPLQDAGWYDDSWDFPTRQAALQALETWNPEEASEPTGWHRHVSSGRFRIEGNEHLEYVRDAVGIDIEAQVAYAVKVTQGYTVVEVKGETAEVVEIWRILAASLPDNTLCFRAVVAINDQRKAISVYYRCGRYVVAHPHHATANVTQRLTDPWPNPERISRAKIELLQRLDEEDPDDSNYPEHKT